ncbi:RNA-binding protein [Candidatus Micrarchaeota archaeon]|jgi:PUA domain protein|nr:RNA-binding protein [Candidatus Micrarchaeota archaeon]
MKKQFLRGSEIKKIAQNMQDKYSVELLGKKDKVEVVETEDSCVLLKNDSSLLFKHKIIDGETKEEWFPTLKTVFSAEIKLNKITVDTGAIKFVLNGADIMRPGITNIESNIEKGELILIIEEVQKKPLALGIALYNSEDMKNQTQGKVIQSIHYLNDKIWNF